MANKHYPQQFKADAVALYRSRPGATIASIADDLGVNRETLRSWVRVDDQRRGAAPGTARPPAAAVATGSVEDENAQLRRRVRDLEEERDILRKAARYFAGEREEVGENMAPQDRPAYIIKMRADRMMYGGASVYGTTNLTALDTGGTVNLAPMVRAMESSVVSDLVSHPSGALFSGLCDIGGFRHTTDAGANWFTGTVPDGA